MASRGEHIGVQDELNLFDTTGSSGCTLGYALQLAYEIYLGAPYRSLAMRRDFQAWGERIPDEPFTLPGYAEFYQPDGSGFEPLTELGALIDKVESEIVLFLDSPPEQGKYNYAYLDSIGVGLEEVSQGLQRVWKQVFTWDPEELPAHPTGDDGYLLYSATREFDPHWPPLFLNEEVAGYTYQLPALLHEWSRKLRARARLGLEDRLQVPDWFEPAELLCFSSAPLDKQTRAQADRRLGAGVVIAAVLFLTWSRIRG